MCHDFVLYLDFIYHMWYNTIQRARTKTRRCCRWQPRKPGQGIVPEFSQTLPSLSDGSICFHAITSFLTSFLYPFFILSYGPRCFPRKEQRGFFFVHRNNVLCIRANCVELKLYKRNWVPVGLNLFLPVFTVLFSLTLTCCVVRLYSPHRLFPGPVVHIKGCGCFCFRSFFVCIRACTKDRHWL